MSLSIETIRIAKPDEWDHIWWECPYSTYFHSREWAEIWSVYAEGRMNPDPKMVEFSDGKRALLPFILQKSYRGLVKKHISSPAGTFGGWISIDDLNDNHARLLASYLINELGNLSWRLNPYDGLAQRTKVKASKQDETHALNLEGGFESIYKGLTHGHASSTRKAQREGVLVSQASKQEDWLAYFGIYQDSLKRWGKKASSSYRWALFEEMRRINSPHIKLWLAIYQEKVISGVICLYSKNHVDAWHAASLKQNLHLRPVNLVMYEAIKHACEKGYIWFDFNPSGEHEGVKTFKKRFGAKTFECPQVVIETRLTKIIRGLAGA